MIKQSLAVFLLVSCSRLYAQPEADTSWKKIYRETPAKVNDLVHTKLELKPDFNKLWLYGKEWVTIRPHFYLTDSLVLDAKGIEFKTVALIKNNKPVPVKYENDDWNIRIKLDKTYRPDETYTLYIDYIAKPDEFDAKYGGGQLLGLKGMFFINPHGEEKDKPTQIWTQGETESNSAWFPTLDHTNQKTTEELSVTVDNKYVTLSNGLLVSQKKNTDGTRTDYWKMDLPHSPYLFFLGVGEYAVIKDKYKNKEVNYYVEPAYAGVARKIFGKTPEMIGFFSRITGVEYPWPKYAQITGREYVAGAMENTSATLHADAAQQDARQLVDGNAWENTIAHELFHQWFGDYVTTESWSNITLNESFANYSETLWNEYKYGKDAGAAENYSDLASYLDGSSDNLKLQGGNPEDGSDKKDLVRFTYSNREDVFDLVSYQKGGRILHMLRNYVGDSAFFRALNLYLNTYKFKSAEAQQLRLTFEEVTGRDLNWYFNQWYYGSGHPKLEINYLYNDAAGKVQVIVKQTQATGKVFKLPLAVEVYNGAKKTRYNVWIENRVDTLSFSYSQHPDLVNVDADKILLAEKKDNKTLDNFIHQYHYAGNYVDRREAISYCAKHQDDPNAAALILKALNDPFAGLRSYAIQSLDLRKENVKKTAEPLLLTLAKTDLHAPVRASAIGKLGDYKKPEYLAFFKSATKDSSYSVSGSALTAISKLDEKAATELAAELYKQPAKGLLEDAITTLLIRSGDETMGDKLLEDFARMPIGNSKFNALGTLSTYLEVSKNTSKVRRGVEEIVKLRESIPSAFKNQSDPFLNAIVKDILISKVTALKAKPDDAELKGLVDYIKSVLPETERKGF